ncbi:MAG: aminoglycoside phosphotransferase family protein [candidate division KSB1 bacterium]
MSFLHDPLLPHLERVADVATMTETFARKLRDAYAHLHLKLEDCALERVQHRRGRRCRVLYRLRLRDAESRAHEQWFSGKLVRPGQAQRQFEEALYARELKNGWWKPVELWPELNLIVWAFPNDPEMPGLLWASDAERVRAHVNANLAHFGVDSSWRCESVRCVRVKYMPGKRCVLRYHAQLVHPEHAERSLSFYSKTYSGGMSRFHFQNLRAAHEQMTKINIPRPLLHWEEANTYWQEPWEGTPLIDTLPARDWEITFTQLARVLADFHQSHCEAFSAADTLDLALDSAEEDAPRLGALLPQHEAMLHEVLRVLRVAREPLARAGAPLVPLHGTLRVEQFLARGEEYALIDFDMACLGDPHYDLAEFLTSLQFLQFTCGWERARLEQAMQQFQAVYAQHVSWPLEPERLAWYAVVSLLDKLHDALKGLDRTALARLDEIIACMNEWLLVVTPLGV